MKNALLEIKKRIADYGFHRYIVKQSITPRYSYTIGLSESIGFELILGGAMFYEENQILESIFNRIIEKIKKDDKIRNIYLDELGSFELKEVDYSWSSLLMLGAYDYYKKNEIKSFQIFPIDTDKYTLDTPDMSQPWNKDNVVWKYLDEKITWEYSIPENSIAITDLDTLRGGRLTEYFRYDNTEWEIFSSNGELIPKEFIRIVPISVLINIDPSILDFLCEPVGKGKFRDSSDLENDNWYIWE
jgi:hypothetical protein